MNIRKRRIARLVGNCLLVIALCGALPVVAAEAPQIRRLAAQPASALFIGNSFFYHNDGINEHLLKFLRAQDPGTKFRVTLAAISGAGLDWHDVASYFRPHALGSYSFDTNNNVVFNDVKRGLFDVAVMMDCSQCPLYPGLKDKFHSSVKKDSTVVRRHGSEPVLFMSWAYQDRPEMTQQLADAYTREGNKNRALVIPAGLAFARAIENDPGINLYAPDKRHPSMAGTYLAVCVTYATLFGRSPVGSSYEAGLDFKTARELQAVAWEVVEEYFGGS